METKELYISPNSEALEMIHEGVICASAEPQWNNPFPGEEQTW